jgi:hypothetical protein
MISKTLTLEYEISLEIAYKSTTSYTDICKNFYIAATFEKLYRSIFKSKQNSCYHIFVDVIILLTNY